MTFDASAGRVALGDSQNDDDEMEKAILEVG
jgi:hypothetical protein